MKYGSQGKPSVLPDGEIEFNLSHSGGLCVIAVARELRLGVDIEEKSRDAEFVELAERFFAPPERNALAGLPQHEVRDAFYAIWTRKEAYIKALGEGVTHGLDNFSVDIRPEEPFPKVVSERDPGATEQWFLRTFVPRDGFAGALAVEGSDHAVVGLDYVRSKE